MLRSMTARKSPHAYKQLIKDEESHHDLFDPKLSRNSSVPSFKNGVFGTPSPSSSSSSSQAKSQAKQAEKASKVHPIFSLFNTGRKSKRATARPEFSRYMQYLKEGGFGGVIDIAAAAKSSMPGN
ncbi:unnamed protein product [Cuscuta campestris]|uniref:Uncharacterized protein n=1 Tax=Cuscuta campestris TaxID=132261 RepID=A0A484LGI7_9ASTE|nr:unnamed protein product [Cuscuta campestris]